MCAWVETEPAASSALQSADIRAGWAAIEEAYGKNLLGDPDFLIWHAGDSAAPAHWQVSGGPTIARETSIVKTLGMSAKITYDGSGDDLIYQDILNTTDYDQVFDGEEFSFGAWAWSDSSGAYCEIDDGQAQASAQHAGNSAWSWLTGTITVDSAADKIRFQGKLDAAGNLYLDQPTVVLGPIPPKKPKPCPTTIIEIGTVLAGDPVATGTEVFAFSYRRPFLIRYCQLEAISNAGGQAMIVDINHWNGSAWVTAFSTKPEIAVGARSGGQVVDGTYQYRCFTGGFGTTVEDARLGIDVDQAASSGAKNPTILVTALTYRRPLEAFNGATTWN